MMMEEVKKEERKNQEKWKGCELINDTEEWKSKMVEGMKKLMRMKVKRMLIMNSPMLLLLELLEMEKKEKKMKKKATSMLQNH
jgi:hypothetical protein